MSTKIKTLTQVSFTADPILKNKALEKAKKEGITLKAVFTLAMKSYISNEISLSLKNKKEYYDEVFADKNIINKANELGQLIRDKKV